MVLEVGKFHDLKTGDTSVVRFLGDSGCSALMSPRREILHRYKEFASPIPIRIGDDSLVYGVGAGELWAPFGKIKNVLFVPKLGSSLLSLSTAADDDMKISIDAKQMSLYLPSGKLAMTGKREGRTYVFYLPIIRASESAMTAA